MLQLTLSGRLGRDAEVKNINGKSVINFSVACDTGYGDNKTTLWISCAKWGEQTKVAEYLRKGSQVLLIGEPGLRTYEGKDGTKTEMTLRVDRIELIGGKNETAAAVDEGYKPKVEPLNAEPVKQNDVPDDLPF